MTCFFFFNDTATTEIYTLSLHDALPILSSTSFFLPLEKDTLSSDGTTTYIYQNNATYPAIFDLLAEILHMTVPIEIGRVKFGPGEILVTAQDRSEADIELELSTKEVQKLVHARRAEIFTKHAGAAP